MDISLEAFKWGAAGETDIDSQWTVAMRSEGSEREGRSAARERRDNRQRRCVRTPSAPPGYGLYLCAITLACDLSLFASGLKVVSCVMVCAAAAVCGCLWNSCNERGEIEGCGPAL